MKTLALDSSSQTLSVALLDGEELLVEYCLNLNKNHSVSLMPAIDFLMKQADLQQDDLERIVVAQGPGSYTGLRMAVATAKTLAYTLGIELVGISSLYSLCPNRENRDKLVLPLINARRNSVYAGFYRNGESVRPDCYITVEELLNQVQGEKDLLFVGEVSAFVEQIQERYPHAEIMASLPSAYRIGCLGVQKPPVSVHDFVPVYLKRVEAEENWLKTHTPSQTDYIKRV